MVKYYFNIIHLYKISAIVFPTKLFSKHAMSIFQYYIAGAFPISIAWEPCKALAKIYIKYTWILKYVSKQSFLMQN